MKSRAEERDEPLPSIQVHLTIKLSFATACMMNAQIQLLSTLFLVEDFTAMTLHRNQLA